MRILEVRDGFIKFESIEKVSLSAFIKVSDEEKAYIAQVIQVKKISDIFVAFAKVLFLFDVTLLNYDKSLPSINSKIELFDINDITRTFSAETPLNIGLFIDKNSEILVDKKCLNKKTLICIDNLNNNKIVLSNLSKQFKHSIVLDSLGIISENKYIAGVDFKLPLNTESLSFIFEDCLNDATSDSKNLIKEIFQDLADYSKTVEFLPFNVLKTIVDNMVEKEHVFKLLVLKNKLAKFEKMGYFASTSEEATNLSNILKKTNAAIDLSKLESTFLNRYMEIIFSLIKKEQPEIQIFVETSNLVNKKNLKTILKSEFSTTLITHSRFKYINEIKQLFENFIIEPTFSANEVFKIYSTFLKAMDNNTYLVVGNATNQIPLISNIEELNIIQQPAKIEEIVENIEEDDLVIDNNIISDENELEESLTVEDLEDTTSVINEETSLNVIEKKSNILIEKVSEEISNEKNETINIFADDNDEILDDNNLEEITETVSKEDLADSLEENNLVEVEVNADKIQIEENEIIVDDTNSFSKTEEFHTRVDEFKTIDIPSDVSEFAEEIEEISIESPEIIEEDSIIDSLSEDSENLVIENIGPEEEIIEVSQDDFIQENDAVIEEIGSIQVEQEFIEEFEPNEIQENEVLETFVEEDIVDNEIGEIIELDDNEILDTDIIVDFEDSEDVNNESDLDRAIVEDVDKVFTTMKDDTISDSDLDFIDELNGNIEEEVVLTEEFEELTDFAELEEQEDSFLEPLEEVGSLTQEENIEEKEILETKKSSTPIIPVYGADIPAEDIVISDSIEQGDSVFHAKYGNGVVEKMIKYGTKTLYSINFDNIGRRLLDPTLTEIKKI